MTPPFTPQTLPDRALIRLSGEGVLAFLHNLLTTAVEGLTPSQMAYGALLSPQGKIQHELFVINQGEAVYLDCARSQREELLRKLVMYRLRAKIDIAADDSLAVAVGQGVPDPRLADMGMRGLVPAGALAAGEGYHAHRLSLGLADGELDIGQNEHFPHEANLDLLGGVSFSKGCYVGQEVVSRMQHRGTMRTRMLSVTYDGDAPPRGTAITSGDIAIGHALSGLGQAGLALIRLDKLAEAQAPLRSVGVSLRVHKPGWMKLP